MHGYGPRLGLIFLAWMPGCLTTAPPPQGAECAGCHSSDTDDAPWEALGGLTSTEFPGVGAHQAHLTPGNFAPVACQECHEVPTSVDAPGHLEVPDTDPGDVEVIIAEVKWGTVAKTGGAAEPFVHADAPTCTVWCHKAGVQADEWVPPIWTIVDGSQDACGKCHGNPPLVTSSGVAHAQPEADTDSTFACTDCHARLPAQHADGIVQLSGCAVGCHGDELSAAPPPDTTGSSDTTDRGVGAHATHLAFGIPCGTCHLVPAAFDSPGHIDDDLPAEVVFSGIAIADSSSPSWDNDGLTCANTYCHDAGGATVPAPQWTTVDGSQAACGGCHGVPPPPSHPANDNCGGCHTSTDPTAHINGKVDL